MKDAILISLREHLKALKLSSMATDIETRLRQAKESGVGYDESFWSWPLPSFRFERKIG